MSFIATYRLFPLSAVDSVRRTLSLDTSLSLCPAVTQGFPYLTRRGRIAMLGWQRLIWRNVSTGCGASARQKRRQAELQGRDRADGKRANIVTSHPIGALMLSTASEYEPVSNVASLQRHPNPNQSTGPSNGSNMYHSKATRSQYEVDAELPNIERAHAVLEGQSGPSAVDGKNENVRTKDGILSGLQTIFRDGSVSKRAMSAVAALRSLLDRNVSTNKDVEKVIKLVTLGAHGKRPKLQAAHGVFSLLDEKDFDRIFEFIRNSTGCSYHARTAMVQLLSLLKETGRDVPASRWNNLLWIMLRREKRSVEYAWNVVNDVVDNGYGAPNDDSWILLYDAAVTTEDVDGIDLLFMEMRERGVVPSPSLAAGFLKQHKFSMTSAPTAYALFQRLLACGLVPDASVYRLLLVIVCRDSNYDLALELYQDMCDRGLSADIRILNALLNLSGRLGKDTAQWINLFETEMLSPDIATITIMIGNQLERGETDLASAFNFLNHSMRDLGGRPDSILLALLIRQLVDAQHLGQAHAILDLAAAASPPIEIDAATFGELVRGYVLADELEKAEEVLRRMVGRGLIPDRFFFTKIVDAYLRRGNIEAADKLWEIMSNSLSTIPRTRKKSRLKPDKYTTAAFLSYFTRRNDPECALRVYNTMLALQIRPDAVTYERVMALYSNNLNVIKSLWHDMGELKIPATHKTFQFLIHATLVSDTNHHTVDDILQEMAAVGIEMNSAIFTDLFEYGYFGGTRDMHSLVARMMEAGFRDSYVYVKIIREYAWRGNFVQAQAVLTAMIDQGLSPTGMAFTGLIRGCRRWRRWELALNYHQQYVEEGLPDWVRVTQLMRMVKAEVGEARWQAHEKNLASARNTIWAASPIPSHSSPSETFPATPLPESHSDPDTVTTENTESVPAVQAFVEYLSTLTPPPSPKHHEPPKSSDLSDDKSSDTT
ncbi:hypothetical protein DFS34DRAFT_613759 [Phlyctochytrium arcticum]|nr:hypothetical protein DFS34DRAFT_613759 [Phlyctochytrium arcticum]